MQSQYIDKRPKWLRKSLRILAAVTVASILTSCNTVRSPVTKKTDWQERNELITRPVLRSTPYDGALHNFGRILQAYHAPTAKIMTLAITNETAGREVPGDLSQMVKTAVNKVGDSCGAIKLIAYDPHLAVTEQSLGNPINRLTADVIIDGGITEFDKDMILKKNERNLDLLFGGRSGETDIGMGVDWEAGVSRIAIDLNMQNRDTSEMIRGVHTSNSIRVFKKSKDKDFHVAFYGSGVGFHTSISENQGLHGAIRLLVEMSILELLGKYYEVPFWRALVDAGDDTSDRVYGKVIDRFRESLEFDSARNIAERLKMMLYVHGNDVQPFDINFSQGETEIITDLKTEYQVKNQYDLIKELWLTVPIEDAIRRIRDLTRSTTRSVGVAPRVPKATSESTEVAPQTIVTQASKLSTVEPGSVDVIIEIDDTSDSRILGEIVHRLLSVSMADNGFSQGRLPAEVTVRIQAGSELLDTAGNSYRFSGVANCLIKLDDDKTIAGKTVRCIKRDFGRTASLKKLGKSLAQYIEDWLIPLLNDRKSARIASRDVM